jgi:hypothetical protein
MCHVGGNAFGAKYAAAPDAKARAPTRDAERENFFIEPLRKSRRGL